MLTAADFVMQELSRRQPGKILAADVLARRWAEAHLAVHSGVLADGCTETDVAAALIGDMLAALDRPAARLLLGGLIRQSPVVIAAAVEGMPLSFNDFLSLGMQRWQTADAHGIAIYGFDLHTYKTVPDWLNSKYWAHPELWKP